MTPRRKPLTEEQREAGRRRQAVYHATPKGKATLERARRKYLATAAGKAQAAAALASRRSSPEWRTARAAYMAAYSATPEARTAANTRRATPQAKAKQAASQTLRGATPKGRAARRRLEAARRARIKGLFVEHVDIDALYERDGGTCQICNGPIDRDLKGPNRSSKSIDHVIPLIDGGLHSYANVQLAHFGCNSAKGPRARSRRAA